MRATRYWSSLTLRNFVAVSSALLFVSFGDPGRAQAQTVTVIQTTADRANLLSTLQSTQFGGGGSGSYTLQVDATRTYQSWDGLAPP